MSNITSSFVQSSKHETKSNRFQVICPQTIALAVQPYGFELVSLKTGIARIADRAAHQTTVARYRSPNGIKISGLHADLVFKVPHLYGAVDGFLGTYREICSNGLTVGEKFSSIHIKHLGNPMERLQYEIPRLVAQYGMLESDIFEMQGKWLSLDAQLTLARKIGTARLAGVSNVTWFDYAGLLKINRTEDQGDDVFSVFNRIQENIVHAGLRYTFTSTDIATGALVSKNGTARRLGENSGRSVDLNRVMWTLAAAA